MYKYLLIFIGRIPSILIIIILLGIVGIGAQNIGILMITTVIGSVFFILMLSAYALSNKKNEVGINEGTAVSDISSLEIDSIFIDITKWYYFYYFLDSLFRDWHLSILGITIFILYDYLVREKDFSERKKKLWRINILVIVYVYLYINNGNHLFTELDPLRILFDLVKNGGFLCSIFITYSILRSYKE